MEFMNVPKKVFFGRDIVLLLDGSTVVESNSRAKKILGPSARRGATIEFIDSGIVKKVTKAQGSVNMDCQIGESIYDVSLHPSVSKEGNKLATLIAKDITKKREEEEQLHILQKAVDNCSCGVVISKIQGEQEEIIYVNKAFTQLTGYTKKDSLGKKCSFLQRDDREQEAIPRIREAIANGKNIKVRVRNYRKDGSLFWNELRLAPVHNEHRVTHYVGIQTDVTHLIEWEKKVKDKI